MKHKNFFLVTFFLTLFVFQQVQAGATIPSKEDPSQVSFAPPYAPLPTINIFVLWLNNDNTIDTSTGGPHKCVNRYEHHGCGSIDPTHPAPDYPRNPALIPVGQSVDLYLQDVLTIEMDIAGIPPVPDELQAFKAQAVAARTFASWKAANPPDNPGYTLGSEGGFGYINNSTQYQVFIPGSYDDSQVANKSLILQAISDTQGQYLSYFPDGINPDETRKTIDAEFGSDFKGQSADEPSKDYLNVVQDPISTTCDVPATPIYSGWGMSQKGAMRWAKGNQCAGSGDQPWPVRWYDYRQILAHYYTGIDILDGSGGKVAPDYRWNLLNHNAPKIIQREPWASDPITLTIQNTSAM